MRRASGGVGGSSSGGGDGGGAVFPAESLSAVAGPHCERLGGGGCVG